MSQSPRRPQSVDVKRTSYNGFGGLKSPVRPERHSIRGNLFIQNSKRTLFFFPNQKILYFIF